MEDKYKCLCCGNVFWYEDSDATQPDHFCSRGCEWIGVK